MELETRNMKQTNGLPVISVIVPVYNAEKTLRQCVDSILSQNYRDFELLLIDDGLKDNSPAIYDEYAAKDFRVRVFHKINGGVSSARNLGIDHSQGEWITFIDADDYISDDFFSGVNNRAEDLLIKSYNDFKEGEFYERFKTDKVIVYDILSFCTSNNGGTILRVPWAKFYKTSKVRGCRFDESLKIGEDSDFMFNYLAVCKVLCTLNEGIYFFRVPFNNYESKYEITVSEAASSLLLLQKSFSKLSLAHNLSNVFFLPYINTFKKLSVLDWQDDKSKWYHNLDIKKMYEYIWTSLSFAQKFRLVIARVFAVYKF